MLPHQNLPSWRAPLTARLAHNVTSRAKPGGFSGSRRAGHELGYLVLPAAYRAADGAVGPDEHRAGGAVDAVGVESFQSSCSATFVRAYSEALAALSSRSPRLTSATVGVSACSSCQQLTSDVRGRCRGTDAGRFEQEVRRLTGGTQKSSQRARLAVEAAGARSQGPLLRPGVPPAVRTRYRLLERFQAPPPRAVHSA